MQTIRMLAYGGTIMAMALVMTGCAGFNTATSAPIQISYQGIHGTATGGQQPIKNASIYVYAAGTTGYGSASTVLLGGSSYPSTVTTNSSGTFSTGNFTCNAGQQLYITAVQGDPGGGNNPQSGLMAALGECSTLTSFSVNINEITTVGTITALAPFMSGYTAIGSSATNTAGLARAFASVNKLVNIVSGVSTGSALPTGATGPTAEVNTLADALASCINSQGGSATSSTANNGSNCGMLFSYATTSSGIPPTDVLTAMMNIAQNPAVNAASICALATVNAPFSPRVVCTGLNDWTMAITYTPTGLSQPKSTTIDASGNIWVANAGNNSVSLLSQKGALQGSFTGNGLNVPSAIAVNASGNGWVANLGTNSSPGTTVSEFTVSGGTVQGSPFTPGTLSGPAALAFDAPGNLWVANTGNNNLVKLSGNGVSLQSISLGTGNANAVVIDPK